MTDLSHRGTEPWPARRRMARAEITPRVATDLYALAEAVAVLALGLITARFYAFGVLQMGDYLSIYFWPALLTVAALAFVLYRSGLYTVDALARFGRNAGKVCARILVVFLAIALIGAAAGVAGDYSRLWFGLWLGSSMTAVLFLRALASHVFGNAAFRDALRLRVAVYGFGEPLERMIRQLRGDGDDVAIVGIFGPSRAGDGFIANDGGQGDLIALGLQGKVDSIAVAMPVNEPRVLDDLMRRLSVLPVDVRLFPSFSPAHIPISDVRVLGGVSFLGLQRRPISEWGVRMKALLDFLIAGSALILLAPLLLLVAVAIRIDSPGPVLFVQERGGLNNRPFPIYKFRTMRAAPSDEFVQASRNDMRVTRIGRFLRRSSIDELPQLINVLRGEMSIVGPRPHPVPLNERFATILPAYPNRNRVKPGITGWAQINDCRGPTETVDDMRRRLEHDLHYIENWSVWFDLSIIAATPFMGLVHRNAV